MQKYVLILFLLVSSSMAGTPMQFYAKHDYPDYGKALIFASGDLVQGTALKFVNFVRDQKIGRARIYFDSEGGNLMEGIYLGDAIRKVGYETSIGTEKNKLEGICASACTYAFAGGTARYIYYDKQRLGLHQFYNNDPQNRADMGVTQSVSSIVAKHFYDMGINEQAFILASSVKKDQMRWLTKAEALSLNFANNGKNTTTAEIKITGKGQKPYLNIEQVRAEGEGKLLMYCKEHTIHLLAGVVTTNEISKIKRRTLLRNYLELSDGNFLEKKGKQGTFIKGNTLWLKRELFASQAGRVVNSNILNIWTENGGEMRWGLEIDLYPVKDKIRDFVQGCNPKSINDIENSDTLSLF